MPINLSNNPSFSGNPSITTNNNHVYISWWDNIYGELLPVIRGSHDSGEIFDSMKVLNTTPIGYK